MVGMIMGAGYPFDRMVSRTAVRRGSSELPASVYPAVCFVLRPLVSHPKSFRTLPADGSWSRFMAGQRIVGGYGASS